MFISKKNRIEVYSYLFKEGVVVAKKHWNLPKHPEIEEATNLEVIKLWQLPDDFFSLPLDERAREDCRA